MVDLNGADPPVFCGGRGFPSMSVRSRQVRWSAGRLHSSFAPLRTDRAPVFEWLLGIHVFALDFAPLAMHQRVCMFKNSDTKLYEKMPRRNM